MANDEGIITNSDDAKFLALSGYKFNVISENGGECYTYITATPSGQDSPHFVRECSDSQNDIYIGTIFDLQTFRTTKAVIDPRADEVIMFERFWVQALIPIGDMVGFHIEPYDEQSMEESAPIETPTSDVDLGSRARAHKTTSDDLTNRMNEVESKLMAQQAQLDFIMTQMELKADIDHAELVRNLEESA